MKKLFDKIWNLELDIAELEEKIDYWMEEEHFDEEKANFYDSQTDKLYEELHKLYDVAAETIVSMTAGQIDKVTAWAMLRTKREKLETLFAA